MFAKWRMIFVMCPIEVWVRANVIVERFWANIASDAFWQSTTLLREVASISFFPTQKLWLRRWLASSLYKLYRYPYEVRWNNINQLGLKPRWRLAGTPKACLILCSMVLELPVKQRSASILLSRLHHKTKTVQRHHSLDLSQYQTIRYLNAVVREKTWHILKTIWKTQETISVNGLLCKSMYFLEFKPSTYQMLQVFKMTIIVSYNTVKHVLGDQTWKQEGHGVGPFLPVHKSGMFHPITLALLKRSEAGHHLARNLYCRKMFDTFGRKILYNKYI